MEALEIVKKTIRQHNLLTEGTQVIIALSGGPDSVCLLHLLYRLQQEMALELYAVHVNHQIRGEAALQDQSYVQTLCDRFSIPISVYSYDIPSIAKERCISTEDAGRQMRYQAFFEEKEKRSGGAIAVAHNQNDQAETVLMRMMRGTGIVGLGGMEYNREDGVIRPVLDLSRQQIEEYCDLHELHPCIDQTNLQAVYTRNRIRLELMPYMEEHFNENVTDALCRLAAIAREETSFIDDLSEKELNCCCQKRENGMVTVSLSRMQSMKPVIRRRCLQKILSEIGLKQNLSFSHLEQAEKIIVADGIQHQASKLVEFPSGFRMERRREQIFFFQIQQMEVKKNELNATLREKLLKNDETTDWRTLPPTVRCFDYDKIQRVGVSPVLRTRRPGDFIQPLGMNGTKKLQDYLMDRKIPREKRDQVPLVCLGQEVVWVIGGQISEKFKVTSESENILLLEFDGEIW